MDGSVSCERRWNCSIISGVAIAVAVFWGLQQLKISKEIAKLNATREAFRLAADECRHFAQDVVRVAPHSQSIFLPPVNPARGHDTIAVVHC